jgi:folate-binding protein YgfZ
MSDTDPTFFDHEYQALRSGRAVIELAGWSSISITGKDRQTFANNFCTNDVKRLTPGSGCEAFFTSVKGHIVGHGLIYSRDDELLFVGAPAQAARIVEHLDRYVIREDVILRDTTDERSYLLVAGDAELNSSPHAIPWHFLRRDDSVLLAFPPDHVDESLGVYDEKGFAIVGPPAFTVARIEAGFPLYETDFGQNNLPQEIGRDMSAISFNKGCYLGQETVARIDALGHVNQRLVGVKFFSGDVPLHGSEITLSGKIVGQVTSAAYSPQLDAPIAFAMVRREANAPGTRLESQSGECEIVALPLPASGDV